MAQTTTSISEIARYIDEGIETLKWCRGNLEKRRAVERLRELEITISALSLGIQNMRATGVPAALRTGLSPSHMTQGHISQRAFMMPLAKSHCPSIR